MSGMEAMLLDDSSDDDSDSDKAKPPTVATPVPPPAVAAPPPDASQADVSKRLRDLYSPAAAAASNKTAPATQPAPQPQPQPHPQPQQPPQQAAPPAQPIQQQPSYPSIAHRSPPQQQIQYHVSAGSSATGASIPVRGVVPPPQQQQLPADPFAPAPVANMMDRHCHQRARSGSIPNVGVPSHAPPAHLQQPPPPPQHHHRSPSSASASTVPAAKLSRQSSSVSASMQQQQLQQQQMTAEQMRRKQQEKDNFINFTKVLLKYLEQKDPTVYQQVKAVIKECAERNKRREPGYESVTASMKTKLREVVSEFHWKRAQAYFAHFLRQKKAQQQSASTLPTPSPSSVQTQPSSFAVIPGASSAPPPAIVDPTITSSSAPITAASDLERQKREKLAQLHKQQQQQAAANVAAAQRQTPIEITPSAPTPEQRTPSTGSIATKALATPKTTTTTGTAAGASGVKSKGGSKTNRKQQAAQSSGSAKQQQAPQRKGSTSSGAAASASKEPAKVSLAVASAVPAVTAAPEPIPAEIVKEYNEYMELVDHSMNLDDWTSTSLILVQKTLATLSEEQEQLLYGGTKTDPASIDSHADKSFFPLPGWSKRNVISSRTAWAKIRLHEKASWVNEDVAEKDEALAAISEATQIYLKDVLQKALYCGRQRENVDGIRLWHQQVTKRQSGDKKSPLSLRLGCNVLRQLAQSQGNAAMTVKRMEEALERQTDLPTQSRSLDEETLVQLNSMEDASLRPLLGKAVESADLDAKRSYEVYGGKNEESEPPLGRLSKQPRLQVVDFQMGMNLLTPSSFGAGIHRATAMGAGFSF